MKEPFSKTKTQVLRLILCCLVLEMCQQLKTQLGDLIKRGAHKWEEVVGVQSRRELQLKPRTESPLTSV